MRLADFITQNMEPILVEWEAFAATQFPAASHMTPRILRDHARQILRAVAKDLTTSQTAEEQSEKSQGLAPQPPDEPETAAQTHAVMRARSGFDINQLVAEYRALRASVLRLWAKACLPSSPDLDELIRFNEAIDQAVAESVSFFSAQVERARALLLGMLGHDMRNPLQAIQMAAAALSKLNAGEQVTKAAASLITSGGRIATLLNDLVDFNRAELGLGISIEASHVDLGTLFSGNLDQLRGTYPDRSLELQLQGNLGGTWDGARLQQVLDNLVINAIKYGAPNAPVRVLVSGEGNDIRLEVANSGPAIRDADLEQLFDPLTRGLHQGIDNNSKGSLGLGLYIVREIAKAHGGEVHARSDDTETVFAVTLPRSPHQVASDPLFAR